MTDLETTEAAVEEDLTEASLRTWGLSGQPVTWAWTDWQPVISNIRAVNTGFGDQAMVQTALDVVFPDAGYLAANVCLPHPPSAEFVIQEGTVDPEGPPYVAVMRVDLAGDEDLGLPDDQVLWDFGDGTTAQDAWGWEHGYVDPGVYRISCTVPVAGVVYSTTQDFTVGEPPAARVAPEYAERPATVFTSETDDLPNTSVAPAGDEPVEEDAEESMDEFVARLTVAEVLTYAEAHPDEVDQILAAEEAGKGRAGILDKLG